MDMWMNEMIDQCMGRWMDMRKSTWMGGRFDRKDC